MNPIPVGSLVRTFVSLAKDSARVADRADRFSAGVKPIGTPMRLIASEVRTMSDVGQDFGNIVREIGENRSSRLLSRNLPSTTAVESTIESCRDILDEIETAISKATKRIATDPDYLDHVVRLNRREREAYGLTDIDLSILYLKVRRAVADLSQQKEVLIFAALRTEHRGARGNDSEMRRQEREIQELTNRLENMTDTLQKLRERSRWEPGDESQFTGTNQINGESGNQRNSDSHNEAKSRITARPLRDHVSRREWITTSQPSSQLRVLKSPGSNGAQSQALNITHNGQATEVTSSEDPATPKSVMGDAPVDLEVWQFSGSITSTSNHTSKKGESHLIPISPEDISKLLDQQRKQKTLSALKEYQTLVSDVQDQIQKRIAERENVTGLRWSIASIEIEKPNVYQKLRRQRTERAQIILQGLPKANSQQPKVLAVQPSVLKEDPLDGNPQLKDISEPRENLEVRFRRTGHRRTQPRHRSDDFLNFPYINATRHETKHIPRGRWNSELEPYGDSDITSVDSSGSSTDDLHHISTWESTPRPRGTRRISFDRTRPGSTEGAEDFRDRGPRSFVATDAGRVVEVDSSNARTKKGKGAEQPRYSNSRWKEIESNGRSDDPVREAAVAAVAALSERKRERQQLRERPPREYRQDEPHNQEPSSPLPHDDTNSPLGQSPVTSQIEYFPDFSDPPKTRYTRFLHKNSAPSPVAAGYSPRRADESILSRSAGD